MQIDDFEAAKALTAKLEKTLPFHVRPGQEFLKMMRDRGELIHADTVMTVSWVGYSGDIGGINCTLEAWSGKDEKERFVVSITHLVIDPQHPLASAVIAYQKKRVHRLMLQDQGGFAAELLAQRAVLKKKKRGSGFGK